MNRFDVKAIIVRQRIENNRDKPWNWAFLSRNPNITWDIIKQNPDKPWDWNFVSSNSNITWDIIQKNPDKPWDWSYLSSNSNITWDIIQQNPDKPWDWWNLSRNLNITWDIVQQNLDKPWNWSYLSLNPSFLCSEEDIFYFYTRHKSACRIQMSFREANMNPKYLICQKRIYREFDELIVEI